MPSTPFERDPDAVALVIEEGGNSIRSTSIGPVVLVPFVTYASEAAIQEHIAVLLDTFRLTQGSPAPTVSAGALPDFFGSRLSMPLQAILVNGEDVAMIEAVAGGVPVFEAPSRLQDKLVIGLGEPSKVGALATHPDGRIAMVVGHRTGAVAYASL